MKADYSGLVYILAVILTLLIAGCVAPPKETPTTPVDLYNPNQFATNNASSTSGFVSEVTIADYSLVPTTPVDHPTFLATTQIPSDITCRIYKKSAAYSYNGSAFTFDQKNPPMYINYTVIPKNVTINKVYTVVNPIDKLEKTETLTYSDYSSTSWFEVTVRNNATKEIYAQEGFGEKQGYSTYLSHSFKVLKSGDLLVELRGNDIQASTSIWVKPQGNFEESRLSEFTTCMYWDVSRDTLVTAKPTTISGAVYTWTPENQVNR
jgi:hypothetical protein